MFNFSEARKRIRENILVLTFGLSLAVLFAAIDGNAIALSKKMLTISRHEGPSSTPVYETWIEQQIGPKKHQIVMMGSCQLQSMMATQRVMDVRFSIPSQVEAEFVDRGMTDIHVLNLGNGGCVAGRNLHIFLLFLEDPRFKVFVWHNDVNVYDLSHDKMETDPFMFNKLLSLKKKFPDIPEFNQILYSHFKNARAVSGAPDLKNTQKNSSLEIIPPLSMPNSSFDRFWQFLHDDLAKRFEENTFFLREFNRKLSDFMQIPMASAPVDLGPVKASPLRGRYYLDTPCMQEISGEELNKDNICTIRLMGKLAKLYHKKIYIYFGPEGRPKNQEDEVYTAKFKLPLINAVKDLSTIEVIDLTGLEVIEEWDMLSLINTSYLGNRKIAHKMFETLYKNEYGSLH